MPIRMRKAYIAIHSFTEVGIVPVDMKWKREDIEDYLEEHPMPYDEKYPKEDMIDDLTDCSGTLTFSGELKEETLKFLEELMNWLEYGDEGCD